MQTTINTKPMLFSSAMVISLLNNTKTQTRRIVNGTALKWLNDGFTPEYVAIADNNLCTYGKIGDTIWVKETYYAYGIWFKNGITKTGKQKWVFKDFTFENKDGKYLYEDCKPSDVLKNSERKFGWYKRPSLFMPKIASRTTLKITDITIERLQNISEKDAIAEGVERCIADKEKFGCRAMGMRLYRDYTRIDNSLKDYPCNGFEFAADSYQTLWQKINGPESWNKNPYVWVIKFEKMN